MIAIAATGVSFCVCIITITRLPIYSLDSPPSIQSCEFPSTDICLLDILGSRPPGNTSPNRVGGHIIFCIFASIMLIATGPYSLLSDE